MYKKKILVAKIGLCTLLWLQGSSLSSWSNLPYSVKSVIPIINTMYRVYLHHQVEIILITTLTEKILPVPSITCIQLLKQPVICPIKSSEHFVCFSLWSFCSPGLLNSIPLVSLCNSYPLPQELVSLHTSHFLQFNTFP